MNALFTTILLVLIFKIFFKFGEMQVLKTMRFSYKK